MVAAIEAALAAGQGQPWMYDVLAGSMRIIGRPQDEINRVLASSIDFTAGDVNSMMYTAAHFVRYGDNHLALRLYRQASRVAPARPEPYVLGLRLARLEKDYDAVRWAATGILTTAWMPGHKRLHRQAENAAADAVQQLKRAGKNDAAQAFEQAMAEARKRDLLLKLEWSGPGDLDLIVEEPPGTVCSVTRPQTANGGVHVHDGFGPNQKNTFEEYVCAMGMPGKYRVRVRHVFGDVVGKRATLTVVRGLGTGYESVRTFPVKLSRQDRIVRISLPRGRRTALAAVPERRDLEGTARRGSRLRRIFRTTPAGRRAAREFASSPRFRVPVRGVGYTPLVSVVRDGVTMGAMAVVSGDRRYVRINTTPMFNSLTDVFTFSFINTGGNPTGNPGVGGRRGGGGQQQP